MTSTTAIITSANAPIEPIEIPAIAPGLRLLLSRVDGAEVWLLDWLKSVDVPLEILCGGDVVAGGALVVDVSVSGPDVLETDICMTVDVTATTDVRKEVFVVGGGGGGGEDEVETPPVIAKCKE